MKKWAQNMEKNQHSITLQPNL